MNRGNIVLVGVATLFLGMIGGGVAAADEGSAFKNQLFFRGAYSSLTSDRGDEVFTDTLEADEANDGKGGWSIAAGLDLSAMQIEDFGGANLMGEVFVEYSEFSDADAITATSALLGDPRESDISVSELNVTIAPKARFDDLGGLAKSGLVYPIRLFSIRAPQGGHT